MACPSHGVHICLRLGGGYERGPQNSERIHRSFGVGFLAKSALGGKK